MSSVNIAEKRSPVILEFDQEPVDWAFWVRLIVRHKRLVACASIIPASIIFVYAVFFQSRIYEAQTVLLIRKTDFNITADSKSGILDENIERSVWLYRAKTLADMVRNPEVATRVLPQVQDMLTTNQKDPRELMEMIKGKATGTETLAITARFSDPVKAARLANIWTKEYEQLFNPMFQAPQAGLISSIKMQADAAKAKYEEAKSTLVQFIEQSKEAQLARDLENATVAAAKIQEVISSGVEAITTGQPEYKTLAKASRSYHEVLRLEALLDSAKLLRQQIAGSATIDPVPLFYLKERIFGSDLGMDNHGNAPQIQLDLHNSLVTKQQELADLDNLIGVLQNRLNTLNQEIQKNSIVSESSSGIPSNGLENLLQANNGGPLMGKWKSLQAQIANLKAGLESLKTTRQELEIVKDDTFKNYQMLEKKLEELNLWTVTQAAFIMTIAPALSPIRPVSSHIILKTLGAGLLGFLLISFGVYVYEFKKYGCLLAPSDNHNR